METNRNARRGYRTWLKSVRRKETGFHGPGLVCGAVAIFALLWPTLTKAAREFDWFGLLRRRCNLGRHFHNRTLEPL